MRAIALSLLFAIGCAAQITSRFNDTIAGMAAALAESNAPGFLEPIDKRMPGYDELKSNVEALVNQAEVHSGVNQITEDGDDVTVDWELHIRSRGNDSQMEPRRATVKLRFEQQGKKWRIVGLAPVDLFAPPKPAP